MDICTKLTTCKHIFTNPAPRTTASSAGFSLSGRRLNLLAIDAAWEHLLNIALAFKADFKGRCRDKKQVCH